MSTRNSGVRCSRCGRRLKNPKAIDVGMGKICEAKEKLEKARLDAEHQERLELSNGSKISYDPGNPNVVGRNPGESDADLRQRLLDKARSDLENH